MTTVSPNIPYIDDKLFLERFIKIDDKEGNTVSFIINEAQEIIQAASMEYNRLLEVKPRAIGSTTFWLAKFFKAAITKHNLNSVLVTHEERLTTRLLRRVDVMYRRMPIPDNLKPERSNNSIYEMVFPQLNSSIYIGTAGAKVFGRGETIHNFLGSEIAHWSDPNKILDAVQQAVPLSGTMVLESTPNGENNVFYELVQEALQGKGIWKLIDIYWWVDPQYRIPKGSMYALQDDRGDLQYSEQELQLIRRVGWDDLEAAERIRWRRRKIAEIKSVFWQEYVEDLVSCFISTGEPFYDWDTLERLTAGCYPAPLSLNNAEIWYPLETSANEHPVYGISVDPGQGKITKSVANVWRFDLEGFQKVRHEATLSGMFDPTTFAPMVMQLGEYYNWAKIASESNGHGMAFCAEIKNYPNLYYRTDVVSGVQSKQIGWMSTGTTKLDANGTKMYAMQQLANLLPHIQTHDLNLVSQLRQVKIAGNERVIFLGPDDHHDSAMIMAATRQVNSGRPSIEFAGATGWQDKGGWAR